MANNLKILLVAKRFPPIMGSHGRRVLEFVKYINNLGCKLDVLTGSIESNFPIYDLSSLKDIPDSIGIFRVYPGIGIKLRYSNVFLECCSGKMGKKENVIMSISKYVLHLVNESNIVFLFDWTLFAIKKGIELTKRYGYNLMISSGDPTDHLVAYIIMLFKKNMIWIIDYGDPWVFAPGYMTEHTKLKFIIDHFLERSFLNLANVIVVTNEETKKSYLDHYPFLDAEKVKVIPMGVDFRPFIETEIQHHKKFRVIYTGCIYTNENIIPFLKAVKALTKLDKIKENCEILFFGHIDDIYKDLVRREGLDGIISFCGFIPYNQIIRVIRNADVLLSFGAIGGVQVPGKLFDYIGGMRPILWIKSDELDPALRYLEDIDYAIIADNNCKNLYYELLRLYNLYINGQLILRVDIDKLQEFAWENRLRVLNGIFIETNLSHAD